MIGLKRGTVKLLPHNPIWVELFKEEKLLLEETFGHTIISIEHVGSTSIPGIPAKPIIDINIGVESLDAARDMKDGFEQIGYEYRPFVPGQKLEELRDQELYVKGPEYCRTHYIHVAIYGSDFWYRTQLFRDYLCQNRDRAQAYAELKTKLALKFADDRKSYSRGKSDFIRETLILAETESK